MGYDVDSLNIAAQCRSLGPRKLTTSPPDFDHDDPAVTSRVECASQRRDGGNVIEIEVIRPRHYDRLSQDEVHDLRVTRKPTPLASLALSSGGASVDLDPDFAMDTMEYDASVNYASESIRVTPGVPTSIEGRHYCSGHK